MNQDREAFFERLKVELENTSDWPNKYLYKFIVPTDPQKIEQIEISFNNLGAIINTKTSSKGNFTSVSVEVVMTSPEQIIQKYKDVSTIEGIISL